MERDGRAVFNRFLVGAGSRQAGPAGGSCGAVTAPGSATYSSTTAPPSGVYSSTLQLHPRAGSIILSEIMYRHTPHRPQPRAPERSAVERARRHTRAVAARPRRPRPGTARGAFPSYLRSTGSACALIMGRRASASTAGSVQLQVSCTVKYCHCGPPSNRAQARS